MLSSCIGEVGIRKSKVDQYALARNNSLELLSILEIFTEHNGPDAGAENIHVTWKTNWGFKTDELVDYTESYFGRKGTVYLTMDGEFSGYYMRKREEPVPWSINIYGGRNLYINCVLQTDTTGGNDFISVAEYLKDKKMILESVCYDLKEDAPKYNMPDWRKCKIKMNNGKIIYVLLMTLVLNGSTDQQIYFNADGSSDITLPKEFLEFYTEKSEHACLY